MSLSEEVDILRNIPMFANIETSKLKLLAFTSDRLTFAEGEILFRQGEPGDSAYILLNGKADIIIEGHDGPINVASLQRNDIVGEIAILCDVPRTATVQAASKLEAMKISKDLFFRLVQEFPQIGIEIMRELAHRLEDTTAKLHASNA